MTVLRSSELFELSTPETRRAKGPLVTVQLQPGRFVKMHRQDAIAQGLLQPEEKAQPPTGDKMRPAAKDKAAGIGAPTTPDDLTTIPGVGQATARLLQARGINTFDQLRQAATLDFLSAPARQAIEEWRQANG